jgi:phenylalanyl-tRNA synthetase beta chain
MLELGQPLHAFDADKLVGPISVRHARVGESLKLLDEREVTLATEFLLVTDADRAVALGGVMGGWESRVTDSTTKVFFEAAHWIPSAIIGRARKLGMHTDAGHRFERGVDPELPRYAIERATALVQQIMGGRAGSITEATLAEHLPSPTSVPLRRVRLARVLGVSVPDTEVERILRALGMQVTTTAEGWSVLAPTRRFDIAIEEDLIEEIARIHGYEAIPVRLPTGEIVLAAPSETQVSESSLRRQLVAHDYLEAINYAFVDAQWLQLWQIDAGVVALANPLTNELGAMRTSLLPGLAEAMRRNCARQLERVRLFEIGRSFHATVAGEAPVETRRIAAIACGRNDAEQWALDAREVDFYDLKAEVDGLLALAGARAEYRYADQAFGHPGRSASVWRDGVRVGWVGHLHPRLSRALDLQGEIVGFELDLDPIVQRILPAAGDVSRYPSVRRDLAVVVPEAMPWSALERCLWLSLGARLQTIVLFDQYRGPGLEMGAKSLAMGLILQDVSRTLTDQDADQAVSAALAALAKDCGARLRG